jgi:hypothetical protein
LRRDTTLGQRHHTPVNLPRWRTLPARNSSWDHERAGVDVAEELYVDERT